MADEFPNTRAAVEKYDAEMPKLDAEMDAATTDAQVKRVVARMEELARNVGVAFGVDTAEFNNPKTCADCVRPGPPIPQPGAELSFVRKMLIIPNLSRPMPKE